MKIITNRILLSIGSIVFVLFISDIFLAKFFPQETLNFAKSISPACFAKSENLPFVLKRGSVCHFDEPEFNHSVSINNLGFRGKEFEEEKPKDTLRILIVGDSFTFGHGVEDNQTYSAILERMFKTGRKVEVVNGGYRSAFSPDSYYLFLKNSGLDLSPDLVIMGFFIWNDISDLSETNWDIKDQDGLPIIITSRLRQVDDHGHLEFVKPKRRYQFGFLANSNLFQFIYSYKQSFFDNIISTFDKQSDIDPEKEARSIYNTCIFKRECFSRYHNEWGKVKKVIIATKKLLDDDSIPLLIILIPAKGQLESSSCCGWEKLSEQEKVSINEKLILFFEKYDVNYLDLYQYFKTKEVSELYYQQNAHWTSKGHFLAADTIYNYVISNLNF